MHGGPDGRQAPQAGKEPRQGLHRAGLQDDLHPVELVYPADGGGHGAANRDAEPLATDNIVHPLPYGIAGGLQPLKVCIPGPDNRHSTERRQFALLTVGQFGPHKAFEIVAERKADGRLVRQEGLDNYLAAFFGSARPPRDLRNELKRPFVSAKIGQRKGRIGADHPHQCYVGKVQAFGQHLRAGQDVHVARGEVAQQVIVPLWVGPLHAVSVDALHAGRGELPGQFLREPLGADTDHRHVFAAERA